MSERTDISVDEAFPPARAPKEYPQREIFAYGRYIQCQILNWNDGPPPVYIACNPLDRYCREPFLAKQAMGAWCRVDLVDAIRDLIAAQKDNTKGVFSACEAECDRLRLRLKSILEWHQNWAAPFHDEPEWIGDYRLAREELGLLPPAPSSPK